MATAVIASLTPLINKGLEKLAEKTAEEGFNERKIIWDKVKDLFRSDDLVLLNLFENAKTDNKAKGKLEGKLETYLELNPVIAEELEQMLIKLSEASSTNITNENIVQSEINNKILRKNENQGKAEIINKAIETSIIKNEMDIS